MTSDDSETSRESAAETTTEPSARSSSDERPGLRRGLAAHVSLRAVVLQYFYVGSDRDPRSRRVLPDGSIDLIFNLGEACGRIAGAVEPQACVVGILTKFIIVERPARAPLFGVSIAPGAAATLLDLPIRLLKNRVLDLRDLWGSDVNDLLAALRRSTRAGCCQHMDSFLIRKLANARQPDRQIARAVTTIRAHGGRLPMHQLAGELGVSERQLERAFRAETGIAPKQFSRIARLQTTLARIGRPPRRRVSWAELAGDLGFSDQAHLIREFRSLTGVTPTEYAREKGLSYVFNDGLAET